MKFLICVLFTVGAESSCTIPNTSSERNQLHFTLPNKEYNLIIYDYAAVTTTLVFSTAACNYTANKTTIFSMIDHMQCVTCQLFAYHACFCETDSFVLVA